MRGGEWKKGVRGGGWKKGGSEGRRADEGRERGEEGGRREGEGREIGGRERWIHLYTCFHKHEITNR